MKPFEQILCPVDFSDFSRRALTLASRLARDFEAGLTLFHVMDMRAFSPAEAALAPKIEAANRRRVQEQMVELGRGVGLAPEQVEIAAGLPHKAIVQRADSGGVDLVVMGTHGLSGFERLLLGSVTEKVLHQLHLPLLAVSQKAPESILNKEGEHGLRTILVATDFGSHAAGNLVYAAALAQRYGARLVVVHVVPSPEAYFGPLDTPWAGGIDLERVTTRLKEDSGRRLERLVTAEIRSACAPELVVESGRPSATILEIARRRQADLIVLGAHGRGTSGLGWVGSVSHRVLRSGHCPVLALRPRE
ncbi:MAG: universal stress protein [Acidobacteriota bacterium]